MRLANIKKAVNPEKAVCSECAELRSELDFCKQSASYFRTKLEEVRGGDLSVRIPNWDEFGDFSPLMAAFNGAVDLADTYIRESTNVLEHISQEQYFRTFLEQGMPGNYLKAAKNIVDIQAYIAQVHTNRNHEMLELANNLELEVQAAIQRVQATSEIMHETTQGMATNLEDANEQANNVANTSTEISTSVEACALALEAMSSSAEEITAQSESSLKASTTTEVGLNKTNEIVNGLAQAIDEISTISNVIKEIAGQTNLLALNATIEAARAGEAGKGFTVVASEVKDLANQTAIATGRVDTQLKKVQQMAQKTSLAIEKIGVSILESSQISKTVAKNVEQQMAATEEMNNNISTAAEATKVSADNIQQVAEKTSFCQELAIEVTGGSADVINATRGLEERVSEILSNLRNFDAFNRRDSHRQSPAQSIECSINANGQSYHGVIKNISAGGAAITVSSPLRIDDKLGFNCNDAEEIRSIVIYSDDNELRLKFSSKQHAKISRLLDTVTEDSFLL
ncbi:MAG: PilZ domain-containing protein [Gammaproteobacteria bacterium]|nr:PilZ domain-containing protein [Gammaproteobacteria bacterium]MBQ0840521.1 PilZ domain-containing protein [Gammaproteobacteria bacterium]